MFFYFFYFFYTFFYPQKVLLNFFGAILTLSANYGAKRAQNAPKTIFFYKPVLELKFCNRLDEMSLHFIYGTAAENCFLAQGVQSPQPRKPYGDTYRTGF